MAWAMRDTSSASTSLPAVNAVDRISDGTSSTPVASIKGADAGCITLIREFAEPNRSRVPVSRSRAYAASLAARDADAIASGPFRELSQQQDVSGGGTALVCKP